MRNFCEQAGIKFEKQQKELREFTFREFKKHIDRIVRALDFQDKIDEVGREFFGNSEMEFSMMFPTQIDSVIDLLEYILHDENDWIGYWLFELNCGKRYKPGMVTEEDGTDIPLTTIEDLWNLLTKENKNEN